MASGDSGVPPAALDEAVVAFTGRGRRKTPASDSEAVAAFDPAHADELLRAVRDAVRLSDAIRFDEVAPSDTGLRERLHQRIRDLLPHLGPTAVEALAWRWGHLTFR